MERFRRGKVLIADDDPDIREVLADRLRLMGFEPLAAADGAAAMDLLRKEPLPLVLLDLQMPRMSGIEVLRAVRQEGIDTSVIVITAWGTVEQAVEAMREGAYDFIAKPIDPAHLEVVIGKALERKALREQNRFLASELEAQEKPFIGESAAMGALVRTAQQAAASNSTILLLGESGTGKELLARAIHRWSPRREGPLVVVNCVALSEELLQSELFGHERGAFTGAHQMKRGKLEYAEGGTVFLDEIGDIKPALQAKLLRLLQEQEFERVGGTKPIRVEVRFIAATNRDLEAALRDGSFRADLYYRLNVVTLSLPPLRQRREELPLLVPHFIKKHSRELKRPAKPVAKEALEILSSYHWPGNVRELENVIERAVVLSTSPEILPEDLPLQLRTSPASTEEWEGPYHETVLAFKRHLIANALRRAGGNQTRAAGLLGLQRTYLSRLIKELGVREATRQPGRPSE